MYSPGGFRRAKPASAVFPKYGVEELISRGERDRSGSERALCMLRSATTRRGTPRDGKRVLARPGGPSGRAYWWSRRLLS